MFNTKQSRRSSIAVLSAMMILLAGIAACGKFKNAESLVAEARQYQQKGDNKSAIIQLKNALQKNPDNSDARYLLGTIYYASGDLKSSEKELRKAMTLGMSPDKVWPALGKTLMGLGAFQEILDDTKQMSEEKPSPDILSLRGNAYLALGKGQEAKDSFELALRYKGGFADALIGLGGYSLLQKDVAAASGFAEQAISQNPENAEAWKFKANLLRLQGKAEPALAAYEQALKLRPDDSSAHIGKAALEIASGQFDAARSDVDAARKETPSSLVVVYTQALLDFRQGKPANALESLQQVLRAAPDHMPSLLMAGAVQYSLGSMPQAEHYLKKYLEKDPSNPYARKLLASTLLKSRQTQSAIDVLSPALQDSQNDPQLFALAGESYMQAGDFAKAEEYFAKASALAPNAAGLHSALGLSKLALGENDLAIAEMDKAVTLDVKSPKAAITLVLTHLRLRQYDQAVAAAKTIQKERPNDPLGYNLEGAAYVGKSDVASARTCFEKAHSIDPVNLPAVVNLARLDVLEKKPGEAKKRLEALLDKDKKNVLAMSALAGLAQAQGDTKEATQWLERASSENPDAVQPAETLAIHYLRIGEKEKALAIAQKLEGSNPQNPDVLDLLAQAQFANGDKTAALETYNKIAAIRPDSALAQFRIASVYVAMHNDTAATEALNRALALQPAYLDAQLALIAVEVRKQDYDGALSITRQIEKKNGKSPLGYLVEGDVLMAQKKAPLAVKAYEQAFALGKSGSVIVKLHAALTRAGKAKEANSRLAQWLKEHPADIGSRVYLAETDLAEKQNKAAIEQFQAILQQEPKNVVALNDLAWAYQQEKDARALDYAEQANEIAPNNPAVLDTLGWILVDQGNWSRGLPLLQKATTLAPNAADIQYHFAVALLKSGDKAKARKELEQLLASGKTFGAIDEARALLKQL
jgi:putative PEP-CTERM system TPR-repeat lipoprotein